MKGYGLALFCFPWTSQRYYNQVLAFTKQFRLRLAHSIAVQVLISQNKLSLRLAHCVLSVDKDFCES